jgi:hypothetical protein
MGAINFMKLDVKHLRSDYSLKSVADNKLHRLRQAVALGRFRQQRLYHSAGARPAYDLTVQRLDARNAAVLASPNHSVELRMSQSPSIVPEDSNQDIYLVLDDFCGRLGRA